MFRMESVIQFIIPRQSETFCTWNNIFNSNGNGSGDIGWGGLERERYWILVFLPIFYSESSK